MIGAAREETPVDLLPAYISLTDKRSSLSPASLSDPPGTSAQEPKILRSFWHHIIEKLTNLGRN